MGGGCRLTAPYRQGVGVVGVWLVWCVVRGRAAAVVGGCYEQVGVPHCQDKAQSYGKESQTILAI